VPEVAEVAEATTMAPSLNSPIAFGCMAQPYLRGLENSGKLLAVAQAWLLARWPCMVKSVPREVVLVCTEVLVGDAAHGRVVAAVAVCVAEPPMLIEAAHSDVGLHWKEVALVTESA